MNEVRVCFAYLVDWRYWAATVVQMIVWGTAWAADVVPGMLALAAVCLTSFMAALISVFETAKEADAAEDTGGRDR